MRRFGLAALICVCACSCAAPVARAQQGPTAQSTSGQGKEHVSEESPNDLFIVVGKSVVVDSAVPIERVSVGLGEVAEATAINPKEVLVNGKAAGQTSLIIWQQGGGKLFFDVTVQPSRYSSESRTDAIRRQMSKELPGSKIDVSVEGDQIFLRGNVKDLTSANRALAVASSMGKPVDLLYVEVPAPDAQILLKVKFASVDRSLSRQLGINIFSTGATNTIGGVTTQQFSPPVISNSGAATSGIGNNGVTATLSNALNLLFFRPDLNLGGTIQALEAKGLLEILAEPNVLAQDGKQASFLAGGEFPFPVVQSGGVGGNNAVTVQFRQFGVRLNFIPTITPRGSIRLQVAPEVSSLDYANGVTIQGVSIPGVSIRSVNTEVELAEGQSFAIGGLLDNRETETFNKIPFIGDIPVLGKLFQSKITTRNNTELMVIVTPEIVRPIPAGQALPGLKYPVAFLPPNTGKEMSTPGQNVTGPVPVTPPTATMPAESLRRSFAPETPLVVTSSATAVAAPGQSQQSMGATGAPTAAGPAPTPVGPPQQ